MMVWRIGCFLLISFVHFFVAAAFTNSDDFAALQALKSSWKNFPPNWATADPCGDWDGIRCINNRVYSITLSNTGLSGQLSSDITKLSELQILDLSSNKGMTGPLPPSIGDLKKLTSLILVGCGFSGQIPSSIGSLLQLKYLSLNSNKFIGQIPASIGNLAKLYWLDLADNNLTGEIPVSSESTPGLDMLTHAKHFHFGNNQLSGSIPPRLFNANLILIHVLFENNKLTGSIPSTLGLVKNLEVVRLDTNSLTGPVPQNLNNLTSLQEMYLANNNLNGPLPNLTGMNALYYVDMSNNSFDPTDVPSWFSSLQSLTSLIMENTSVQGQLPVTLFNLPQLQTVMLKNNRINGTLSIGSSYSSQLSLIDLRNNYVDSFNLRSGYQQLKIILVGNLICNEGASESYCTIPDPTSSSYNTSSDNCVSVSCTSLKTPSPTCKCAYPFTGRLFFRATAFSIYVNPSILASKFVSLHDKLITSFRSHSLPVDSVSLSSPIKNMDNYLQLNLQIFPSGQDYFNHSGISDIGFMLSNQTFKPPSEFGPYYFVGDEYQYFSGLTGERHKSTNTGVIIGAAVGGGVLFILLLFAGVYAFRQRKRAETASKLRNPFASWDTNANSGGVPQLKGAKSFTFEELKRCTNNFLGNNDIGEGGYGKVYRGILPDGQLVAVKRAQQGSMQGGLEFKTEIELLSRVHHKNVVALVGFCFDQAEQMLVYEYVVNGTLKDSLSGRTGIRLDWERRLRIALGAAKGVQYLHDLANPPIIHRDIKSNNILLDDRLTAKVADFGLSKPLAESEGGHVTTQVKGTMGYLDPEYYMTQQLTEKSDVYSFGVLLLELLTARPPIEKGKYVVREVKLAMDTTKAMYSLHRLLDPIVASSTSPRSVEKMVDLALRCVEESGENRPTMGEVVKEIEYIMEVAGLNPNAESASTSASHEVDSKSYNHPYSKENLFAYSGAYPPSKLEAK